MPAILAAPDSASVYVFLVTFVYAIGFVEGVFVPKTIDSGPVGDAPTAVLVDAALLAVFALQHSIMAWPAFKRVWTRIVPEDAERSTYSARASRLRSSAGNGARCPSRCGRSGGLSPRKRSSSSRGAVGRWCS